MITIENLSFKHAKSDDYFFKNLCTSFPKGEVSFIKGKNGVGKSTFFRGLRGEVRADEFLEGRILSAGKSYCLGSFSSAQIPQKGALILAENRTVEENLQLALLGQLPTLRGLPKLSRTFSLLSGAQINLRARVCDLSGGQQQLLGIAAMLQKEPQLLLLDEPTAALDQANARLVVECLIALSSEKNIAILVVTHDSDLLIEYAQSGYYELVVDSITGVRSFIK
jgi:ABC-type cobalamin/Fe3+-siderophores transport system ATPase subunit